MQYHTTYKYFDIRKLHIDGSVALCLYIPHVIDPIQIATYCKEAIKTWFKSRIINIDNGMVHLFTYHELKHCNYESTLVVID